MVTKRILTKDEKTIAVNLAIKKGEPVVIYEDWSTKEVNYCKISTYNNTSSFEIALKEVIAIVDEEGYYIE
ncbi:MAG: hypothetical protein ACOCP8_02735 [archaeon]